MARFKFIVVLFFFSLISSLSAQLHYEGMVFQGLGKPFLDNASAVDVSPDGQFLYVTSFDDGAISLFERNSDGSIVFVEAVKNELNDLSGLTEAREVKVSPDNRHVYATGYADDALLYFEKDESTGKLTLAGKYINGENGIEGLNGAFVMDFSPDGNFLYVIGREENAVAVFQRNVNDGSLELKQVVRDDQAGVQYINYPTSVKVSPDGNHVMVVGYADQAISCFNRNGLTGTLTFNNVIRRTDLSGSALEGPFGMSISGDGKNIYIANTDGNSVDVFSRNINTGAITHQQNFENGTNGVSGLQATTALEVSADGQQVYVAGTGDDAMVIFDRNTLNGQLTYQSTFENNMASVTNLDYPVAFAVSEHFNEFYVADFGSNALLSFEREDEEISFGFSEKGNGMGVNGLQGVVSATLSPDGNHLYAAGDAGDAVVIFEHNQADGKLNYLSFLEDGNGIDGLNGAREVLFAPNGIDAYIAGYWDNTVSHFTRDVNTGALTFVDKQKDGLFGVDGIAGANSMVMTNNGNYVFASGFWDNAIAVFEKNESDGSLDYVSTVYDGQNGVEGIGGVVQLLMNDNDSKLYAVGSEDEAVVVFDVDVTNGSLSFNEMLSVAGVARVALSPQGNHLYSVSETTNTANQFLVNDDGTLVWQAEYLDGIGGGTTEGLEGVNNLAVSHSGELVYFTSQSANTIAAYRRDPVSGDLIFEKLRENDVDGVHGISGVSSIIMSTSDKFIYATSATDQAIATFSCSYFYNETTTICQGQNLNVGGNVYNETGIYQEVIEDEDCIKYFDIDLTVQPMEYFYELSICDGDIFILGNQAYNQAGTYSNNFVSAQGCDSLVTVELTTVGDFDVENRSVSICEGEVYELGGNEYSTSGLYEVVWETEGGCDSTVMLDLAINGIIEVEETAFLCDGEFYVFGDQNYIEEGTYTQVFSQTNGCDSIVTLVLVYYPSSTEIEATICEGEAYEFVGENYTDAGTYEGIVMSNSGCEIQTTLYLEVLSQFEVEATINEDEGNGLGGVVLQVTGGAAPYIYFWNNGVTISEVHNLAPGVYTVTVTDANGCSQELEYLVNVTTSTEAVSFAMELTVFPNPIGVEKPINLNFSTSETSTIIIDLIDVNGRRVISDEFLVSPANPTIVLRSPSQSGIYFVNVVDENGQRTTQRIFVCKE